jgi:hypothetical protein
MTARIVRAILTLLFGAAALSLTAAGCSDGGDYGYDQPTYYGENGHCYYVTDPYEVVALQQAGLCPVNWTPMLVPSAFETRYYVVYHDGGYRDRFVPKARRDTYNVTINNYGSQHKSEIDTAKKTYQQQRKTQEQRQQSGTTYGGGAREQGGDQGTSRARSTTTTRSTTTSTRSTSTSTYGGGGARK